jgi:pSer/pThr/pTyr-binding forkhead associated (FHA) protein
MERKEFPSAFLIIGGSRIYPITQQVIRIGRSLDNDLTLDHPQVSRKHAELFYGQGSFFISDLGSLSGTFVNGEKIIQKKLEQGDVITLANLHLIFGQDVIPESPDTLLYENPEESEIAEQDTQSFNNDDSRTKKDKKSSSY